MMIDLQKFYACAQYAGAIYTIFIIVGVSSINLIYTCPALEGDCSMVVIYAIIIIAEVLLNLFFFQYTKDRNQVAYWTVKSSTLLMDESEHLVKLGKPVEHVPINVAENGEYYRVDPGGPTGPLQYHDPRMYPSVKNTATTKFCYTCNIVTPRRCHHCPLCNMCVLRKDHHCFLTGGCVGLANQRYFIVFLLWASIGAFYGAYYNVRYLNEFVSPYYPFGWINWIAPVAVIRWIFAYDSFFNMALSAMFSLSFASGFAALCFFVAQMYYTFGGYTMHDYHVGRHRDHLEGDGENWKERLELVFGRRWYLNFIFPQFWIPNQMTPAIARNIFLSISKDL